jgi:hypothetical protein
MYLPRGARANGSVHADPDSVSKTLVLHVVSMVVSMRIRMPYPKHWDFLHLPRANNIALHSTIKHTHAQRPDMKILTVHALRNVYVARCKCMTDRAPYDDCA